MMKSNKHSLAGFTLIEIMITVAIVAILAALAIPAYQESVRKSRRSEARAALTEGAQNFERFFTQNNGYSAAATGILPASTAFYTYSIDAATTASTFLLTATPTGAQASDKCGIFKLDQLNNKTVDTSGVSSGALSASECWPD